MAYKNIRKVGCYLVIPLIGAMVALSNQAFAGQPEFERSKVGQCRGIPEELANQVKPGNVILVGEVHGTREIPAAFSDLVCHAVEQDFPTKIGIEFSSRFTDSLDAFVNTTGSKEALGELEKLSFWHVKFQDGKRSEAMYEMLEAVRRWNVKDGTDISVFSFDANDWSEDVNREKQMAKNIQSQAGPGHVTLILTGNLHSRTRQPDDERGWSKKMGHYLTDFGVESVSVNAMVQGGSKWVCRGPRPEDCGVSEGTVPDDWKTELIEAPSNEQHDFTWFLGPGTASRPAFATTE